VQLVFKYHQSNTLHATVFTQSEAPAARTHSCCAT